MIVYCNWHLNVVANKHLETRTANLIITNNNYMTTVISFIIPVNWLWLKSNIEIDVLWKSPYGIGPEIAEFDICKLFR